MNQNIKNFILEGEKELREQWREDFDLDNFTKNDDRYECIADFWLEKFSSRQISLIKMIVEIVNKVEVTVYDERISKDVVDIVEKIVQETKDTISSKLKELYE